MEEFIVDINKNDIGEYAKSEIHKVLSDVKDSKEINYLESKKCIVIPKIKSSSSKDSYLKSRGIKSECTKTIKEEYKSFNLIYFEDIEKPNVVEKSPPKTTVEIQETVASRNYAKTNVKEIDAKDKKINIKYANKTFRQLNAIKGFPHQNFMKHEYINSDCYKADVKYSRKTKPSLTARVLSIDLSMELPVPAIDWKIYEMNPRLPFFDFELPLK